MLQKMKRRRPSPAMVVALVALVAALGGTAYAAGRINGNLITKGTIAGSKLKHKTLNGNQINVNKIGEVPLARRTTHTFWAVVHNPAGAANATLTRSSDTGAISAAEGAASTVTVTFPYNVSDCAVVAGRNNDATVTPQPGYAQTNSAASNVDAVEVHTRNKDGNNEDSDFQVIVVCP